MKIYLFDIDGVIVNSDFFTKWIEEEYWIDKEFLDVFFINDFPDCLIWKNNLKNSIKKYLDNSKWIYWVDELLEFWFNYENKPNLNLLKIINKLRDEWNICCIVSNQEKERSIYIKNNMNFSKYFDDLFFSCDLWCKKPELDFFNSVFLKLQKQYWKLDKNEITFYDDEIINVENWNLFWFNSLVFDNKEILWKKL